MGCFDSALILHCIRPFVVLPRSHIYYFCAFGDSVGGSLYSLETCSVEFGRDCLDRSLSESVNIDFFFFSTYGLV